VFGWLGCTAFGGPAAHVSLMESAVVARRGWLTRAEFLDQLAIVQLLPGPNSTELAIHLGWQQRGWRGGVVAGCCFVLPSVLLVWLLAAVTVQAASGPLLGAILTCVTPVVVAVLVQALWKFGGQAAARPRALPVMVVTTVAAVFVPSELLILLVGALMAVALSAGGGRIRPVAMLVLVAGLGALALPAQTAVTVATAVAPTDLSAIFGYFLRAGVGVFGSGYVLFAYLQDDLVVARHWVSADQLAQASLLAQVTPGPLFSMATAVGFSVAGHFGALAATIGIFAPAFLSVTVGVRLRRLVERSPVTRSALDGVVIGSVALLGRAVATFGWALQPWQWVLTGAAAAWLLVTGRAATGVLLLAVLGGLCAHFLHFSLIGS
jgi:chromate transporter